MIIFDEDRPFDSPYVERVWRAHSEGADPFLSIATSRCELVFSRLEGETRVTMRGPETKATQMGECPGGGEWFGIILTPGAYLPLLPPERLVDGQIDLPVVSSNAFCFCGSTWQLPNYENADTFLDWLARQGLLVYDRVVDAALGGPLKGWDPRTVQRHFRRSTGLPQSTTWHIERARYATCLLQEGVSILDTVLEAGYFDQPHLTRQLTRYIGQTPAQIREQSRPEQLSFLYKTVPIEHGILSLSGTE
jgi:hypothetical protein